MIADSAQGLFCEAGGFHVDPLVPVARAVITHAHADHGRAGSAAYLCTPQTALLLRRRVGPDAAVETLAYGERKRIGAVDLSFHPAGHMLGSAQVRIESAQGVWVISGDYKREADPSCAPFEPQRCDAFVTEATYALPLFRWDATAREIFAWWSANERKASLLFCYALGKAQRILAELALLTGKPVYAHGAVEASCEIYRSLGVRMLPTLPVGERRDFAGELVVAPLTARGTPWMKRFRSFEAAFVSGLMRIRGTRRRRGFDRGFALSDHADWPGLLETIRESGAARIFATHGHRDPLVRYLRESGLDAAPIGVAAPVLDPEGD